MNIKTEDVNPIIRKLIENNVDFNEIEITKESLMDTIFKKMKKGIDVLCYGLTLNLNSFYCLERKHI